MLVYRIERPNGQGPYMFPGLLDTSTEDSNRHPMPVDDGLDPDKIERYHYFGFMCLHSLRAWFDRGMREFLFDKNCLVRVYDVADHKVMIGNRQVVFDRDGSNIVKTLDILYFSEIFA
jgi:hypothetical protein